LAGSRGNIYRLVISIYDPRDWTNGCIILFDNIQYFTRWLDLVVTYIGIILSIYDPRDWTNGCIILFDNIQYFTSWQDLVVTYIG